MKSEMKKLTVGDNSGCNRAGDTCTVVRTSVADIDVGEVVKIRFKGEFDVTPWRHYRLEGKHFRDELDAQRGRYTATFSRVEGQN
jgi:hypothetical protein